MIHLDRPFRILAHRGASGYAPENTLASFDLALTMLPDAIETDLRLTRDGVIVLNHDETVDRMTDGTGPVASLTWDEVSRLTIDAGNGLTAEPQRVLHVGEFFDRYLGAIPLCLEIKAIEVVAPLVEELSRRAANELADWIELTSFEPLAGAALREAFPSLRVGMLLRDFEPETIERTMAAGYRQLCPSARHVTADGVERAHAAGVDVRTWGVHTEADLHKVLAAGADGTTLNWPDWIARPVDPDTTLAAARA
jgi:glycerophosphoryl diester phosphodiesterase